MKKNKLTVLLFLLGNISLLIGAFLQMIAFKYAWVVFSLGVVLVLSQNLKQMSDLRDADIRERRLSRNGVFAALILGIGAYFMYEGSNSWVVALLIYALTSMFLTFRTVKK